MWTRNVWMCIALGLALYLVFTGAQHSNFRASSDLVIVTSHWNEDLGWLKNAGVPVEVCDKPGAKQHPLSSTGKCNLPKNKGREASSYISYILNNWDTLPRRIAFIHGHETADHQNRPEGLLELIKRANPTLDYVSLNDSWHTLCLGEQCPKERKKDYYTDNPAHILLKKHWKTHFQPYLNIEFPYWIQSERSAQFVVSHAAIKRYPKEAYEKWFDLLMSAGDGPTDDYFSGMVFEFVWHMLFGNHKPVMTKTETSNWFLDQETQ